MQAIVRRLRSMMTHPSHSYRHSSSSFGVDGHLSQSERVEDEKDHRKSCRALEHFDRQRGTEDVGQSRSH